MQNATWRMKTLQLAEWTALQHHFANFQLASGAPPNLAMFAVSEPGETDPAIYITGPGITAIEALSPGGWADAEAPSGQRVALLVGEGDPWAYFGITKTV